MVIEHKKEANSCLNVNHPSPKSKKMKKVPQRGMGVAQLEKIRIEEQQQQQQENKNNSTSSANSSAPLPFPLPLPLPLPLKPKQPPCSPLPSSSGDLFQSPSAAFDSGSTITVDASNPIQRFSTSRFVSQTYNSSPSCNQQNFLNITLAKNTVLQPSLSSGVVHLQMEPPSNQIYHRSNVFSRTTEEGTNPWSTSGTTVFDPLPLTNVTVTHPYLLKQHANDSLNFESSFRERASTSGATHQVDLRNSDICTNGKVDWRKKRLSGNSSSSMDGGHISLAPSASRTIQHHRELHDFMPSSGYGTEDSQQRFFNFIPVPPPRTAREPADDDSQQRFFNFVPPPLEPVDTTLTLRDPEALEDVDTKLKL